jgi:hypothetical protein
MWSIDLGFTKLGRFAAKSVFLNGGADKNWTNSYKKMWFKNRNAKSCFPNPIFLKDDNFQKNSRQFLLHTSSFLHFKENQNFFKPAHFIDTLQPKSC